MKDYLPKDYQSVTEGSKQCIPFIVKLLQNSKYSQDILDIDTWQPANLANLELVFSIVGPLIHNNSAIINAHHFTEIQHILDQGKSCIIMPEHYSNFDLPGLFYLIQAQHQELIPVSKKIISLSAAKLNAESKAVLAFSEGFNRIMIYPARAKHDESELNAEELAEQKKLEIINQRAIKSMLKAKDGGKIILMFPSGTRYRPEKPESRQALEQAVSFLKRFDYVCFIGIAGNTLVVNPNNNMEEDLLHKDSMVYWIDKPIASKDFMDQVEGGRLNKKGVAKHITEHLYSLHQKAEAERAKRIAETPTKFLGPIMTKEAVEMFIEKYNIDPQMVQKLLK